MPTKTNQPAAKLQKTSHDLPATTREKMVVLLNTQLADTFDLFSQTKQAHWNVKGLLFYPLHELYDSLAGELVAYVDLIAERAVMLGGVASGTARMAAKSSRLEEFSADAIGSRASVEALVQRYADLAKSTRAAIDEADEAGDMDTADLFTEVSRGLDKALWFLEAHTQKE